ncbi:hypothetical protein [Methylocystis sp. S23]
MFWLLRERYMRRDCELWDNEIGYYEKHKICPLDPNHGVLARRWGPAMFREEPELEGMSPLDRSQDAFATPRSSFVFTRRVFEALEEAGLTGWTMNPATVSFADGTVSNDFGELWINGFGGVAQPSAGCKLLWRCRGCGQREYQDGIIRGEAVRQARWDGSDFFIVWPLVNYPICTDRAKDILERFRMDKIIFRKPEEDLAPINGYSDTAVPPYYKLEARAEIEAFWAKAPVWPDDFEKPCP